jgi:hypothetical protein
MKIYGGVEEYFHHSWPWHWMEKSGQYHAPAALPLLPGEKAHRCPFDTRVDEPQIQSGLYKVIKNSKLLWQYAWNDS